MAYIPIHDDHAIAAVAFAVTFQTPLDSKHIDALIDAHAQWKGELPGVKRVPSFSVELGADAPTVTAAEGVRFLYAQPDGAAAWEMTGNGPTLMVVCRVYTRWDQVWAKARSLLEKALAVIGGVGGDLEIAELTLEVNDGFKGSGEEAVDILLPATPQLAPRLIGEKALWHQHSGWFTDWDDQFACLVQLNIDLLPQPDNVRLLQLVHRQILRPIVPITASQLTTELMQKCMKDMHEENKAVMKAIISKPMLDRIGLK